MGNRLPYPARVASCLLLVFLLANCADYRLREVDQPKPLFPESEPVHSVFLLGDSGLGHPDSVPAAFPLLRPQLQEAPASSTVIFLGNQLRQGFPSNDEDIRRAEPEKQLDQLGQLLAGFDGNTVFLPGNRDWQTGVEGLKRQRRYLEKMLGREDIWTPDEGCGGPAEIELTEELVLIIIDSQWWISDWSGEPEINAECAAKSRSTFRLLVEDAMKGNREKTILVAMHHAPFAYGPHAGAYTALEHLFPLRGFHPSLWLPLPGLGSLPAFYRSALGSRQDLAHPMYKSLRETLINMARNNGPILFASAHEQVLQYIQQEDQDFIVSGSAARVRAASLGDGALFSYGRPGFARLDFMAGGAVWLRFFALDEGATGSGRVVFTRRLRESETGGAPTVDEATPSIDKTVLKTLAPDVYRRNGLGRVIWGRHYRDAYLTELKLANLRLDTFRSGVIPVKMGGGYQTNSLRLENPLGRQYTMRSVDKDPSRTVPYPINRSRFLLRIVKDAFNASHPYAALAVPDMADAIGVYHTNPAMYNIPRQAALAQYNEKFGDAVYLVEERPDDEVWQEEPYFGKPEDIVSTADVIEEVLSESDHRIDRRAVVRSRLFDLVLGDWDRHDDQWRWSATREGDTTWYRPIPRDRDQVFSNYDGLLYHFVRQTGPAARPLRPYHPNPKKIKWSNYGSRHFDATFLDQAPWSVWEEEIVRIQAALTDELIEQAIRDNWPPEIFAIDGPRIITLLKARRDHLPEYARDFYRFRVRTVDVVGTQSRDLFEVERLDNDRTRVSVFDTNREGERESLLFQRIFLSGETRAIHLYGLSDDDIFRLSGSVRRGPLVRIIAGIDEDRVVDESRVAGLRKKTLLYDAASEARQVEAGGELRSRVSADPVLNTYNRRAIDYEFDFSNFLPSVGYNPDDGILLGVQATFTTYGYKKEPFATQHKISMAYATVSSGISLAYTGDFIDVFPKADLRISAATRTPLYTYNYYGLGNETENLEDSLGVDYYRVRQRYIGVAPALRRRYDNGSALSIGASFESYRIDTTGGRFIDDAAPTLDPAIFDGRSFAGVFARYHIEALDDPLFPKHGLAFDALLGWRINTVDGARNFPYFRGHLALYQQVIPSGKLVFATRIGGEHIFNNKFEFFQGATLGGVGPNSNFRGFRRERFTGRSSFYQNIDLRWEAIDWDNNLLPLSMGLYAGFDHGRVWLDGEDSDVWHYSYGGGIWLSPLTLVDLMFNWFRGDDEVNRFTFGGRFFF